MNEAVDPKVVKSARAKKRILAMMDEYEEAHTPEENVRMFEWVITELESSNGGAS